VDLKIQWVPRIYNTVADDNSEFSNTDDWGMSRAFFEYMIQCGDLTILTVLQLLKIARH
jgi:hypothetical protein